jgi:hypothetical protein
MLIQLIVPVELLSFNAEIDIDVVTLKWSTATETNNLGFEVLSSSDNQKWNTLAFINGNGTTTLIHNYQFTDQIETSGIYFYKLKQIDFDGTYKYSNTIEILINSPTKFTLEQNYPNPFNPTTIVKFDLLKDGLVTLEVYDILGRKITTLINEQRTAGRYEQTFDASSLASGVYFYKLQAGDFISAKKMILLK